MRWQDLRPIFRNLDNAAARYALAVEQTDDPFTNVEMPWGIQLGPIDAQDGDRVLSSLFWRSSMPRSSAGWNEIWSAALAAPGTDTIPFEVEGIRGFKRRLSSGSEADGTLRVVYDDDQSVETPDVLKVPPMTSLDRLDIATSLSRRFPYTGTGGTAPKASAIIEYHHDAIVSSRAACYETGRSLPVEQFRVSPRGGWLKFDGSWKPYPGCELSGWVHSSNLGRLEEERIIRAGFLYPFGIEAELVISSERAFIKDEKGHYVAALVKQAYLRISEDNLANFEHLESIFKALRITTLRTPPLDVAENEDPVKYATYDFFLPPVDGKPFALEHVGTDWVGGSHTSRMPLVFVSNRARAGNGLIWEQGSPFSNTVPPSGADASFAIPKDGDGLRHVDKIWNRLPHRFAQYGSAPIATAEPLERGDTSQKVEWAEWVRGQVPKLGANGVASRPFEARTRTAKVELRALSQFSGSPQTSLVTYRDTRFCNNALLDPEPTAPDEIYRSNLPAAEIDAAAPYLFCLETRPLRDALLPLPALSREQRAALVKKIYFFTEDPATIPDDLFASISNEVQFGMTASAEATGGLAVPDIHASACIRTIGVLGDATFNERRWSGYAPEVRDRLELKGRRLDYAAFRLNRQSAGVPAPFDASNDVGQVNALTDAANSFMGYPAPPAAGAMTIFSVRPPVLSTLGDLFGGDAELLPGIPFSKLFETIGLSGLGGGGSPTILVAPDEDTAVPPAWNFRIVGLEWLTALIGSGPGQFSVEDLIKGAQEDGQNLEASIPLKLGLEASLAWNNKRFVPVDFGAVKFSPRPGIEFAMNANARMDLGQGLPLDLGSLKLEPGRAEFTSSATLKNFSLKLFDAIEVIFESVSFAISPDGKKSFETEVADVLLSGPLAFLNQLSDILGGIGSDFGVQTELTPARVAISQTIRFPPKEGDPLYIGPAQITNLSFGWALTIPLIRRDVLSVGFHAEVSRFFHREVSHI
jgi:hypothetical protein